MTALKGPENPLNEVAAFLSPSVLTGSAETARHLEVVRAVIPTYE